MARSLLQFIPWKSSPRISQSAGRDAYRLQKTRAYRATHQRNCQGERPSVRHRPSSREVLGTSDLFWLNLQARYDLKFNGTCSDTPGSGGSRISAASVPRSVLIHPNGLRAGANSSISTIGICPKDKMKHRPPTG